MLKPLNHWTTLPPILLKLWFVLEQIEPLLPTPAPQSMQGYRPSILVHPFLSQKKNLVDSCLPFRAQLRRCLCWDTLANMPRLTDLKAPRGSHSPNTIHFCISVVGLLLGVLHHVASNLRTAPNVLVHSQCLTGFLHWGKVDPQYLSLNE